jgi:hypothetical protein
MKTLDRKQILSMDKQEDQNKAEDEKEEEGTYLRLYHINIDIYL